MASGVGALKFSSFVLGLGLALVVGCGDGGSGGTGGSGGAGGSGSTGGTGGTGGSAGTGGSGGAGGGANAMPVIINFEGRVGNELFDCNATYSGLGSAVTDVKITDYRFYVHDLRLVKSDGTTVPVELDQDGLWQLEDLALLDFENKTGSCANGTVETNAVVRGKAPPGTYNGVAFKVGVPFSLNHADVAVAPSPLNLSALFWNWNGGYKFLRIDALPTAGGTSFNMHLGSTGCVEDTMGHVTSCDRPNRPEVFLTGFDPLKGKVIVDYAALISGNDLSQNTGGKPGCMAAPDDPECAAVMGQLGIHVADGTIHPEEQKVFTGE